MSKILGSEGEYCKLKAMKLREYLKSLILKESAVDQEKYQTSL